MPRSYVYVIIGALAFLMVSAGVYGFLNVNLIQAKPELTKLPDYSTTLDSLNTHVNSISSQVDSLKSQVSSLNSEINSISSNLTSLDMIKANLADIHEKLADLENLDSNMADIQNKLSDMENKTGPFPSSPGKILVSLDRPSYLPGDTVHINAIGADPMKAVKVQLLNSGGFALVGQTTWADSTGSILYGLQLSNAILPGQYQIKLSSGQTTGSQSVTINTASSTTTSGSYTLTAQTDKASYQLRDLVQIAGSAQPSSTVSAVMVSPLGTTYDTSSTSNSDGNYVMFFSTLSSYPTGNWYTEVTNLGQTKILSFALH